MKIKGIPFYEQHLEKFIVGLFAAIFLAVLAMQFVGRPNDVPVDGQSVAPGEIEPRLRQKADSVRARLSESSTPVPLVEGEIPLAFDRFKEALTSGVSRRPALPPVAPALAAAILPGDITADEVRFRVPTFPAPRMVAVRQESDTLLETVVQQYPELGERFAGWTAPFDITWAIPVAELDIAAMRTELAAADPSAKPPLLAIPSLWYNDSLWLVDVLFERQVRQADGSWSPPQTVATLPGQFSFRKELATADAGLRDAMFGYLAQRDKVVEIVQPDFLATKGNVFSPALILGQSEAATPAGEDPAVRRARQTFNRKRADRERVAAQLAAAGGPLEPERPEDRRSRDRSGSPGGGPGGGAGSGSGSGGGPAPPGGGGGLSGGGGFGKRGSGGADPQQDEATKRKRMSLTQRLRQLDGELSELEEELKVIAPALDLARGTTAGLVDLARDERLLVWGHDIDVRPGGVYRYRATIHAYNPFFTRKRQLVAEQQSLADPFTLTSSASEWGPAVTVEPPIAFFVADAAAGEGRLGLGMAKVEVYRFFDGERRLETFVVQPGDRVGGPTDRPRGGGPAVDFATDWFVVDVLEDVSGERGDRRSAQVVLRRQGSTDLVLRSPRTDLTDDARLRFNDDVEVARAAAGAARRAAAPDSPPPPAGPTGGSPRGPGAGGAPPTRPR